MPEISKVWSCWKVGDGQPFIQHNSKESALAEAARVAAKTGTAVIVMEAIGFIEPLTPPTRYTEL